MRRLAPEEKALWQKVVATVRPLNRSVEQAKPAEQAEPAKEPIKAPPSPVRPRAAPPPEPRAQRAVPGVTLDGSWDRRLSRGLVQPDITVDLHGHNLDTAYSLLDSRLEQAVAAGARVLLLITGKPPNPNQRPIKRGAIRAAVGDWLAGSRHARDIAAVRGAHPRHGGTGALYIILRRQK